jgi:hypothetical protein
MEGLYKYITEAKHICNHPLNIEGNDTYSKINGWLKKLGIKNFRINGDMTISTDDSVDLSGKGISAFPSFIQFKYIGGEGIFDVSDNDLKVLRGCPVECNVFYCNNNPGLRTLRGGPEIVDVYNCSNNNIVSLSGAPKRCVQFLAQHNPKLTSLKEGPKHICGTEELGGVYNVSDCGIEGIEGLVGCAKIEGTFKCTGNPGKITKYYALKAGIQAKSFTCDTDVKKL